jgi:2-dehydro-3-deoxyphosphogluconate aldolase/(4S)-4-hydroxy-2-oxoglutarate aldolase
MGATRFAALLGKARVLPALRIDRADDAVPLARALLRGGLHAIEITLRSEAAIPAIAAIARAVPEATVGAGTVLTADDVAAARDAGARFLVSPGYDDAVVDNALGAHLPVLPGVFTASEVMRGLGRGLTEFKFFPSEPAGLEMLRHLNGPLPGARFCATGGVGPHNAARFLSLPNVFCVGGSWMAPRDIVAKGDWAHVEALATAASRLVQTV